MKKSIFSFAALLLAACTAFISCNNEILEPDDNSAVGNDTYTLTVLATKGDAMTKALSLDETGTKPVINATWTAGDEVDVYLDANLLGTLTAGNVSSDGSTCTLSGQLNSLPPTGSSLKLRYIGYSYLNQDGTLTGSNTSIDKVCDCAEATVTATVSGTTITCTDAVFENQQAIVKFVLMDELGNKINPTDLTIDYGPNTVASLPSINTDVYTANGQGTLFVALPGYPDQELTMTAVCGDKTYVFKKSAVTFTNGTYKIINVKMFNELVTPLTFEAMVDNATVTFTAVSGITFGENVQYSTNGSTWATYNSGTAITLQNAGDKVRFRGTLTNYGKIGDGSKFSTSGECYVYGNVMSLIGGESFATTTGFTQNYAFSYLFKNATAIRNHAYKTLALPATTLRQGSYYNMFQGCTGLTTAPVLPATTLADYCYYNMFNGCTSLVAAPNLTATALAQSCYENMFYGCTSLSAATSLPATDLSGALYCYRSMFQKCTSLTTAPTISATTLSTSCFSSMFSGCSSLTNVQSSLPAAALAQNCYYNMFYGCTNLSEAPSLPATTLADGCYYGMFQGCTSLSTAPDLTAPALAPSCYEQMFYGCTSLSTAPSLSVMNLSGAPNCYRSMFYGCTSLTTAPNLPATTLSDYCYLSMFSQCTNLTTAPTNLPALTLTESCYKDMFNQCSNLTNAPVLPAATLTNNCYYRLFYYCSKIESITCLATDISATDCTKNWVSGVAQTGIFTKAASMTGWKTDSTSGIPNNWDVVPYSY